MCVSMSSLLVLRGSIADPAVVEDGGANLASGLDSFPPVVLIAVSSVS